MAEILRNCSTVLLRTFLKLNDNIFVGSLFLSNVHCTEAL